MAALQFSQESRQKLLSYIPPQNANARHAHHGAENRPFVTLTYSQSLDSQISLVPGQPTILSGNGSKAMTHYLRSVHDAILVGSGTAIADDPGLNCRLEDVRGQSRCAVDGSSQTSNDDPLKGQPRPVVLDRRARWNISPNSQIIKRVREGNGKAPWIVVSEEFFSKVSHDSRESVESVGGQFYSWGNATKLDLKMTLRRLAQNGIESVMIEGGGTLINEILAHHQDCVDSLIITIAPVFLGAGGVGINPQRQPASSNGIQPVARPYDVSYMTLDQDVIVCARMKPQPSS